MIREEKIGHREALTLIVILLTAKIFLSFPRNLALLSDAAGWITVLLAGICSLIGWFFLNAVLAKYPELNLVEIAQKVTGGWIGKIIGLLITVFFMFLTALYLRQFAESFILAILPHTPISVISLAFLFLLVYANLLGIEILSRVAWLFGPYLVAALILIIGFALPQAKLDYITPALGPGVLKVIRFSFFEISSFAEILLLGIIAPLIRKREKRFRVGVYGLILATLINTALAAITVMVFNYVATQGLIFPALQLSRLISFGEFFQRVEALFVFLWFFWAGIQLGGLFYGSVTSFAQTFKIEDYRPLIFPVAVLVFAVSMIPSSMTQAVQWSGSTSELAWLGYSYSGVAFGIPLLLWCWTLIRGKVGGNS
ncbi:spore germination protein (amino acid permease) [Hydrogenispora ethanolica]|uniref:Spore germination protein (Amino acid permease) n=1 Tax=Hydrogenispora ethanolica TaxID=1082276 RepID=A0A4R1RGZ7_HYDET|nr:endospore germination permease [Hydrogenispora ethanolica]TCL65304.1 spore germination protein (amino acid permease) [Hydrogenispora ethanolica]